ncbi:hypothetical protein IWW35_004744, partial [Coemansia sp. RSA 1878]
AKLTDDIVFCILNRATTDISNGLQQWKKSLYVLAVCRQWRALGKFILYSWGFVGGKSKPYKLADVPTNLELTHAIGSSVWDNFAHTQGQLVFNDLEHLTLACTGLSAQLISTGAAHNIHSIPTPSFPRITRLTLSGICIEQSLLERMLRPPLKCLEISWWLFDFKRLNILDLRFLDTLKIWHNLNSDSNYINFFDTTNSIFSMAKGVRLVQLSLYTVPESIQWKHAQWSHLTRLHLDLTTTLYYLFNMVPMFTGLWELKIGRLRMPTEEECADPDTYLPDLKLKMRPSASKIKNLLIEFRPQFSPEYTNKVVAMLRWYMPMLVLVSIPSD